MDYREVIADNYYEAGIRIKDFKLKETMQVLIEEKKKELENLQNK